MVGTTISHYRILENLGEVRLVPQAESLFIFEEEIYHEHKVDHTISTLDHFMIDSFYHWFICPLGSAMKQ